MSDDGYGSDSAVLDYEDMISVTADAADLGKAEDLARTCRLCGE